MNKRLFLVTALFAILSMTAPVMAVTRTFSDDEVKTMIAAAPAPEQYPQAGGYTILNQQATTINPDGSGVTDWHMVVKILQERGKEMYGDVKHKYNKDSDSVVVVKALTYLADGTVLPVEAKAIHDLTPAALSNAAIYSNIMQKVVNFPGLAPGVTIELKLRTFHRAPGKDEQQFIWGTDLFQGSDPISFKEVSLTVPEAVKIRYTYQNEGMDYSTSTAEGNITHNWTIQNSTQIISEPFMPPLNRVAPRLVYTDAESWDAVGKWVSGQFFKHVKTDGDVLKKANELAKGAKSNDEKVQKIGLFVIKDIRGVAENTLPLGLAGYEPNDADVVLANKYGDWRDKAVLLISLLRAAGIETYPHYVNRSDAVLAQEYPALKQFDAIYAYVPSYKGSPLWINPFGDMASFGYLPESQGSTGLLVKEASSELLAVTDPAPETNLADCRFEMIVQPNGDVDGTAGCQLSGIFDNMARQTLKDATPKEREQYFLATANIMGEGSHNKDFKVSDLSDLTTSVQVAQDYSTPEMGIVQGEMMIFRLKDIPFDFAQIPAYPGQTQRSYNFVLDTKMLLKKQGVIHLPTGFKAVFVSDPVTINNDFGEWQSNIALNADSTEVTYNAFVKLVDKEIDTDEYLMFKKAYDDFSAPKNTLILLEKRLPN
ncbi:MAG: DUF3857 domain-containing transglutaminase family protein [Candidatus Zixiibacteriota bacterium]